MIVYLVDEGGRRDDESVGAGLEAAVGGGAVLDLPQLARRVDVAVLALHLAGRVPSLDLGGGRAVKGRRSVTSFVDFDLRVPPRV